MSENIKEEFLRKSEILKKNDTRPLFTNEKKKSSKERNFFIASNQIKNENLNEKLIIEDLTSKNLNSLTVSNENSNSFLSPIIDTNSIHNLLDFDKNFDNQSKNNLSFLFTSEKAGMEGLDRDQINRITLECTKNSVITKKKQEEYDFALKVVEDWKLKLETLHKSPLIYDQNKKLAEMKMKEIENTRDLTHIWMHLDMDMFYAAIEIRDDPSLKDLPIAVGDERMISTSNYIARKFGVRSAMPGFIGKRLCPQLMFVPCNFEKYKKDSAKIMAILREYDTNLDVRGLDEAFLNLNSYCKMNYITTHGELDSIIMEIKLKIYEETKLTCSIGMSRNKMLAKICSDKNKPDGFFKLLSDDPGEIILFMSNMNIRKIPFVGEKTEQKLNLLGIKTCNNFMEKFVDLYYILHLNTWEFLITSCLGIGSCHHNEVKESINKSISCSETFKMTNNLAIIRRIFESLVKRLYKCMLEEQIIGKNLIIEIRDRNENSHSKSVSLKKYFETENEIQGNGWNLIYSMIQNTSIRLIRIKLSGLIHINPEQLIKKTDNPIIKFIEKMNLNKNTNKTKNNFVKKDFKNINKFENNLGRNKEVKLLFNDNYYKNSKLLESTKPEKGNDLANIHSFSPLKINNFSNIEEIKEKQILEKRENKRISNIEMCEKQIETFNKDLRRVHDINLSHSKRKPLSKKHKKKSNIESKTSNYFKLNDLLDNMKNQKLFNEIKKNINESNKENIIDTNPNLGILNEICLDKSNSKANCMKDNNNSIKDSISKGQEVTLNINKKKTIASNEKKKNDKSKIKKKKTKKFGNDNNQVKLENYFKKK